MRKILVCFAISVCASSAFFATSAMAYEDNPQVLYGPWNLYGKQGNMCQYERKALNVMSQSVRSEYKNVWVKRGDCPAMLLN